MDLEQRLSAVEKTLAGITGPSQELSRLMREVATVAIKSAQRPGGCLYNSESNRAAMSPPAESSREYSLRTGVNRQQNS